MLNELKSAFRFPDIFPKPFYHTKLQNFCSAFAYVLCVLGSRGDVVAYKWRECMRLQKLFCLIKFYLKKCRTKSPLQWPPQKSPSISLTIHTFLRLFSHIEQNFWSKNVRQKERKHAKLQSSTLCHQAKSSVEYKTLSCVQKLQQIELMKAGGKSKRNWAKLYENSLSYEIGLEFGLEQEPMQKSSGCLAISQ